MPGQGEGNADKLKNDCNVTCSDTLSAHSHSTPVAVQCICVFVVKAQQHTFCVFVLFCLSGQQNKPKPDQTRQKNKTATAKPEAKTSQINQLKHQTQNKQNKETNKRSKHSNKEQTQKQENCTKRGARMQLPWHGKGAACGAAVVSDGRGHNASQHHDETQ